MAHGNLSPRQKMINMMYLVLTALLAMNVSAEVLNAFVLVNESLVKTEFNTKNKNQLIYAKFDQQMEIAPGKTKKYRDMAYEVKEAADSLVAFISNAQKEIITGAGDDYDKYLSEGTKSIEMKKDMDAGTRIMLENGFEGEESKALYLRKRIDGFRDQIIDMYKKEAIGDSSAIKNLSLNLSTNDVEGNEGKVEWHIANFNQLPLVAVISMLSKMKTDILNAETDAISKILSKIGAADYKFNKLEPFVAAESDFILTGEEYKARIFIAASDTTQEPRIILSGGTKVKIEGGMGIYEARGGRVGDNTFSGVIKMLNPATNDTVDYPFSHTYKVGAPNFSVSPTAMNVFYMGVDNPVEISASGVSESEVKAGISPHGSITKTGSGKYIVRVSNRRDVSISVSGKGKSLGPAKKFRVKKLPNPDSYCGNVTGSGKMSRGEMLGQVVYAKLPADALFNMRFRVLNFSVSAVINGFDKTERKSNQGNFSSTQLNLIKQVKQGSKVIIDDITAMGADKERRKLNPVVVTVR